MGAVLQGAALLLCATPFLYYTANTQAEGSGYEVLVGNRHRRSGNAAVGLR